MTKPKKHTTPETANLSPLEKARLARAAKKVPENETKRQRFERVAGERMSRVLADLAKLRNTSATQYEYTEADVNKMRAQLINAVEKTISHFERRQPISPESFTF